MIFDILHVQQTPKPEAQLPALTPPLFEHSSLEEKRCRLELKDLTPDSGLISSHWRVDYVPEPRT